MDAPSSAEVRRILDENFVGPIGDDVVNRLTEEVRTLIADESLLGREFREFHPSNGGRGFGYRWREVLAFDQSSPRPVDLVAWVAFSRRGYPAARLYCPNEFVGRWVQHKPSAATWELGADGSLKTTAPGFTYRNWWAIHRLGGSLGDALWLYDEQGDPPSRLQLQSVEPRQLTFSTMGSDPAVVLERA